MRIVGMSISVSPCKRGVSGRRCACPARLSRGGAWAGTKTKEEIVKGAMDVKKGAVIDLSGGPLGTTGPTITTAPTHIGLTYTFREGTTLEGFGTKPPSATKSGDGEKWSPTINVKGGNSAFYSIGVGLPEK